MNSLVFANKIMVSDDGHMISIGRILLPEYAREKLVTFRPILDKDGLGISCHSFETEENVKVTLIIFTHPQKYYTDSNGKI